MTTLTHEGVTYKINEDHSDYPQFIEKGKEISLGIIPPEVSNPSMELLKSVIMGLIPAERQEKFEDIWNGKYYLYFDDLKTTQIMFRWKTVWVYGIKINEKWYYDRVDGSISINFFLNKGTKIYPFFSEEIIDMVKERFEQGLILRYKLSDFVVDYPYDTEKKTLAWKKITLEEVASFAHRWIYERKNFEYYVSA